MPQATRFTVLLIEPDASLRRLIALGLQHRGLQVVGVGSLRSLADQPIANPDLLLLDVDNGLYDDAGLLTAVQAHPYLSTLPMVVLAWDAAEDICSSVPLPLLECLTKPFDARQLHAIIDNLLETSAVVDLPARQLALSTQAVSLASATSLCPLTTAAGLLLTVIGLMLQPVVAALGLLTVLIALLWWTLGKRPERRVVLNEIGQNYSPSLR